MSYFQQQISVHFFFFGWGGTCRVFRVSHQKSCTITHSVRLGGGYVVGRGVRESRKNTKRQKQLKRTDGTDRCQSLLSLFWKKNSTDICAIYAQRPSRDWLFLDFFWFCFWTKSLNPAVAGWTRCCPLKWTERQTGMWGGRSSSLCLPRWRPSWTRDRWRWWVCVYVCVCGVESSLGHKPNLFLDYRHSHFDLLAHERQSRCCCLWQTVI